MPVHIFQVNEANFEICRTRGLAGIFHTENGQTNDTLISHFALMRIGDPVLFYVGKAKESTGASRKELHGVWRIASEPFYDTTPVWGEDQAYPYRVRVEELDGAVFRTPIPLSEVYHLKDAGAVWTFSLMRNQRSVNAVFSMTDQEYRAIYDAFVKVNPDGADASYLTDPYRSGGEPLLPRLHVKNGAPAYEATLMAYLAHGLKTNAYAACLHHYSDYAIYVPTNWGKEIDILLLHGHPKRPDEVASYDIVEVKKGLFDEAGLEQLLDYEAWFIRKRAGSDAQMVRSIAIAQTFHPNVKAYLRQRTRFEKRSVTLLQYSFTEDRRLELLPVEL